MQSPCRGCEEQPEENEVGWKCHYRHKCPALIAFKEQAINRQGTQGGVIDPDLTYPVIL